MSIKIMQEVMECAPVDKGTLLVLVVLADSADETSRECWPSVARLAARARLSDRQVQSCLRQLEERGIIHVMPNAGRSGTNLYRIERMDKWWGKFLGGGEAHFPGGVKPTSPGGVKPTSPEPSLRTVNEPSIPSSDLFTANETSEPITNPKAENKKTEDHFERFWSVYPKKVGKPSAGKNFAKAVKAGADPEAIIAGAERYAAYLGNGRTGEFRPIPKHPQGWLTDERWKDTLIALEPEAPARNYGGHRRSQPWGEIVR